MEYQSALVKKLLSISGVGHNCWSGHLKDRARSADNSGKCCVRPSMTFCHRLAVNECQRTPDSSQSVLIERHFSANIRVYRVGTTTTTNIVNKDK